MTSVPATNLKLKLIQLLLQHQVLQFGSFVTKSGRKSPYFLNFGNFTTGASLNQLGTLYGERIQQHLAMASGNLCLFGPAYKGIGLCVATAMRLSETSAAPVYYAFNRKELKTHGESGMIIGHKMTEKDQVVIVDDVLTGGTSVRESISLLASLGLKAKMVVIGVDRQERGLSTESARHEIERVHQLPVACLASISEITTMIFDEGAVQFSLPAGDWGQRVSAYLKEYGAQ